MTVDAHQTSSGTFVILDFLVSDLDLILIFSLFLYTKFITGDDKKNWTESGWDLVVPDISRVD